MKKRGYNGHTGLWREKPCKKIGWKWQKISVEPCQVEERERGKFEKVVWTSQIWVFKKPDSRVSIDQKIASIDRNRQRLVKKKFEKFRLIENQFRSIETDRGSLNLRKKNTVFEKNLGTTQSIEIEEQNAWVCDDMIFKNKNLSPKFPKLKFLAFSINFQTSS